MASIIRVDKNFDHRYFQGAACAFGVFDGVHKGHQFLLGCACESARIHQAKSIALTFDIDPDEMLHPTRLKKLMSNGDRIAYLADSGVDAVVILPFTKEFASLDPFAFLQNTFNGFAPESLHIGYDFRFGAKAAGSIEELKIWSKKTGTLIDAHNLKSMDDKPITSTRIRLHLQNTEITKANELLDRPYFIRGLVKPGRGEGSQLGFSTANLTLDPQIQALGAGVYAAYAEVDGLRYRAAVSMGISPMFEDKTTATCEVHILDFSGEIYGEAIKVDFIKYLRPMIKFDSVEKLSEAVMGNITWVRENLSL